MSADPRRTRGLVPAAAAAGLAAATATAIVAPAEHPRLAASLVGLGLVTLALAVVARSERFTALASAPILGAAVVHTQFADEAVALWALGVGCGWYVTSELAWESIGRRAACRFEAITVRHRAQEIVTVVAVSLLVATITLAASNLAPSRTVLGEALVIVVVLAGGATAVRRLTTS